MTKFYDKNVITYFTRYSRIAIYTVAIIIWTRFIVEACANATIFTCGRCAWCFHFESNRLR